MTLSRGKFRIRGDTLTIHPSYEDLAIRVQFWDDEVEADRRTRPADRRDPGRARPCRHLSGQALRHLPMTAWRPLSKTFRPNCISDWKSCVARTASSKQRDWKSATRYRPSRPCARPATVPGIENYSRHLARRAAGSTPWTLLDYFPDDWLLFIDESHMTIPQVRGMYGGDTSRKQTLVDFGFRLRVRDRQPPAQH